VDKTPSYGSRGPKSLTQRFSRDLSLAARENGIPADVMVEWLIAILEGHGQATIKRDERTETGWRIDWPTDGELASTMEQKERAWDRLRLAGYGQPAQSIHLEADIRARVAAVQTTVPIKVLSPAQMHAMRAILQAQLPEGEPASQPASIDSVSESATGTTPDQKD
jgi:hypothetical protein